MRGLLNVLNVPKQVEKGTRHGVLRALVFVIPDGRGHHFSTPQVEGLTVCLRTVVAFRAMFVEDGLNDFGEIHAHDAPGRRCDVVCGTLHSHQGAVGRRLSVGFVAAYAGGDFTGPSGKGAAHPADFKEILVERLQKYHAVGRHPEMGGTVRFDRHGTKHDTGTPAGTYPHIVLPGHGVHQFRRGFQDTQIFYRAACRSGQALVNIGHNECARHLGIELVGFAGQDGRPGPGPQGDGRVAGQVFISIDKFLV